uniref:Putative secreted protein n=1 Tax=Ixodes ricinus TaxID=34613 RepID=A0A6B0UHZ4_IXORI
MGEALQTTILLSEDLLLLLFDLADSQILSGLGLLRVPATLADSRGPKVAPKKFTPSCLASGALLCGQQVLHFTALVDQSADHVFTPISFTNRERVACSGEACGQL